MTEQDRIKQLREELHKQNYLYYVKNEPIIGDFEFDELLKELQALEEKHPEMFDKNSPTQRVGNDMNEHFKQVKHKYPMLSLGNTYNEQDVKTWYEGLADTLGLKYFDVCCEMKYDGLSISLTYINGELIKAVTRGDGMQGDDVTLNVKTIKTIPLKLQGSNFPTEFEMRGEIVMPFKEFDRINKEREENGEQPFVNPRNAAAGTLKSLNPNVVASRKLDAYLYYIMCDSLPYKTHYENLKAAEQWGFKIGKEMKLASSLEEIYNYIHEKDEERKHLPIATDGIVLKVNDTKQWKFLGNTAKTPRWAIAYKFKAEQELTQLLQVVYQVGRTGAITPVAEMQPVFLSGTMVKRATLNNENFISSLNLHDNDFVFVEKGGEIIPKIVGVSEEKRSLNSKKIEFIKACPECGTPLVKYENEAAHYCPNYNHCPPQVKGRIEHFISRKAMNIDSLGSETINEYYNKGLITTYADLYELKVSDIDGGGNKMKSANNIISSIENSKSVPFERVLFALGIRFVGEISAKILAKRFKNIDNLMQATSEELCNVDGIGNVIAASIKEFFLENDNLLLIERLKKYGLQMNIIENDNKFNKVLEGKTIVISGVFEHHSRDEYKEMIELYGGKNTSSISKNTSFILGGSNIGPSKIEKAEKMNIKIINENDFLDMCKQ